MRKTAVRVKRELASGVSSFFRFIIFFFFFLFFAVSAIGSKKGMGASPVPLSLPVLFF